MVEPVTDAQTPLPIGEQEVVLAGSGPHQAPFSQVFKKLLSQGQDVSDDDAIVQAHLETLTQLKNLLPELARDPKTLQTYWETQVAALTRFAVQTCPFYQNRAQAGVNPIPTESDPESCDDLKPWLTFFYHSPTLSKRDVQQHLKDLWSETAVDEPVHFWMTSGSTGEPTRFIVDELNALARDVSSWYCQYLIGNADIQGAPGKTLFLRLSSAEGSDIWYKRLPLDNHAFLWKLPVFRHPSCDLIQVLSFIRHEKPLLLAGDPQAYLTLIDTWKNVYPHEPNYPFPLKSLTCGGNQLSSEARQIIEDFFQRSVTDCYGLAETYLIASQCSFGTFHIHAPINMVEIMDDEGHVLPDGDLGEIVVTNLLNWAFPFIRYRTGDLGRMNLTSTCPCGIHLPELIDFQGRKRRFLLKASGDLLAPQTLVPFFVDLPLYQYQLIQNTPNNFQLRYIPKEPLTETQKQTLIARLANAVGSPVTIEFESDSDTLVEPGVKFQDFISLCHDSAV